MLKNCVAALDVGSSKISVLVGQRGVNDTLTVKYMVGKKYDGFAEGKFLDVTGLEEAVSSAIKEVGDALKTKIAEITVGVPGTFARLENRKYKLVFEKKKKISSGDIEDLFDAGQSLVETEGFEIINRSEIYFALDDNRRVFDPVGASSSMLGGYLCYTLCEKYFTETLRNILKRSGIQAVSFVFEGIAENLFFFDERARETPSLVIDCGYITTTAFFTLGKGLIAKHSEDFGSGLMEFWMVKSFGISSGVADKLQRMLNLSLTKPAEQTYKVEAQNGYDEYSAEEINSAAFETIDAYVENLEAFIAENSNKLKSGFGVYITGGGMSYIRGIREYLSSKLGVPVDILKPKIPSYSKPEDAAELSVLDYALAKKEEKKGLWSFFRLR